MEREASLTPRELINLLRFFFTQRVLGFTVGDQPHLDAPSLAYFQDAIQKCHFYLEYGSGGTTVAAVKAGKPFLSVDTDDYFLRAVHKKIGRLSQDQRLVHVDIGLTGLWGRPVMKRPTPGRMQKWARYAEAPWELLGPDRLPDLVVVDGRFRIASTLTALHHLAGQPEARVLFDDYTDRACYREIEAIVAPEGIIGRMAIFRPAPGPDPVLLNAASRFGSDWR